MRMARLVCLLLCSCGEAVADVAPASFTMKPVVSRDGEKTIIRFEVSARTDVEVAIVGANGKVVRHLAAGVLGGVNPPPPPLLPGLQQQLTWDGKDDGGSAVEGESWSVRVRLGMRGEFDRFLLYDSACVRSTGIIVGWSLWPGQA